MGGIYSGYDSAFRRVVINFIMSSKNSNVTVQNTTAAFLLPGFLLLLLGTPHKYGLIHHIEIPCNFFFFLFMT